MEIKVTRITTYLAVLWATAWISRDVTGLQNNRDRPQPLAGDPEGTGSQADSRTNKLIISTILQEPYMRFKQGGFFLTGNDKYEGFLADLLAALSLSVGFGYELRLVRDGKFGSEEENGTWTGMIGEVYRGMADIAIGPITITDDRTKVVDFTDPFLTFQSCALIKKPRHAHRNRKPRSRTRLKTLEDIYQSDYNYGVVTGSLTEAMFQTSHEEPIQSMWSKMANSWPSAFVHSFQEGIQRARRERYAFILDSPMAEYISAQKPCDFYTSDNFLQTQHYGFALRHTHSIRLRESLNQHLRLMKSSGEFQALYEKWWQKQCDKKRDSGEEVNGGIATNTQSLWRYVTVKSDDVTGLANTLHHSALWQVFTLCSLIFVIMEYIMTQNV